MARIMGIDYGIKRCGVATTDALQIAVHPLKTVEKKELVSFLHTYIQNEEVEKIVFGHPELDSGRVTPVVQSMMDSIQSLRKLYPDLNIDFHPEDYTSQDASKMLIRAGIPKKKRREKGTLDLMAAILILKDYMGHY